MIELPEAITVAKQLGEAVGNKTVSCVLPPTKPHKFCWFNGDAGDYGDKLCGSSVSGASAFGIYAEMSFDNGYRLCINDGVNVRLIAQQDKPGDYQLLMGFADGTALVFSVAMYGGIYLHDGSYDNEYYLKSLRSVSPLDEMFPDYFKETLEKSKPSLSAKAFLATQQRFPGIGNGVVQDILFAAKLHPKRRLSTLTQGERDVLLSAVCSVSRDITEHGGRDTEKDIYGKAGGYATKMSKYSVARGCPECGGTVVKENYLGGSIYFCPNCQRLDK